MKIDKMKPITTKSFSLTIEAAQQIHDLTLHKEVILQDSCDPRSSATNTDNVETKTIGKQSNMWLQYGCYILTKQHKTIWRWLTR